MNHHPDPALAPHYACVSAKDATKYFANHISPELYKACMECPSRECAVYRPCLAGDGQVWVKIETAVAIKLTS